MPNEAYIRRIPGSRVAILMVHGIMGSPDYFHYLISQVPDDCSIYNLKLVGHCGSVDDFGRSSMAAWKKQVFSQLEAMFAEHEKIIFAGYSLGALFAVEAAIRYPGKICHLFCHGLPIKCSMPPGAKMRVWRIVFDKVKPGTPTARMASACAMQHTKKIWKYLPAYVRMGELGVEMLRVKKLLPQLTVPCHNYQGANDEMLSKRNYKFLAQFPAITNIVLPHSGHFQFDPADEARIQADFRAVIQQYR